MTRLKTWCTVIRKALRKAIIRRRKAPGRIIRCWHFVWRPKQSCKAGFDAAEFQRLLDEQVEAQVAAELLKRGEIQDTVAFAELLAEKQVLGVAALLQTEVEEFQQTSDANIAILESTLARQQEALESLRQDPTLAAEAEAVEQSIAIIEETLQRQREL